MINTFDKRTISGFTIFPKLLDDGNVTGWFSTYFIKQYFGCKDAWFSPTEGSMMGNPRLSDNYWVTYYTFKNNIL